MKVSSAVGTVEMKGAKWGILGSGEVELSPGFTSSKLVHVLGYYEKLHLLLSFAVLLEAGLQA